MPSSTTLLPADARRYLVGQLGLRQRAGSGAAGIRACLRARRCIQLDPLDRVGTNADLVVHARVTDVRRGQVETALFPGHAFEHYAKERCLLPAAAFPAYREHCRELPWPFRRREAPSLAMLEQVVNEVGARGPLARRELEERGALVIDKHPWSRRSWRGSQLALEWLWRRCRLVVVERDRRGKRYDLPERALPEVAARPAPDFARQALGHRVEAAGLLPLAKGPHWSLLGAARRAGLPARMVAEGLLEEVVIAGSRRRYLAPAGFRDRSYPEDDGQMRVLGPLDPLLWDRKLVAQVFGFAYVWEVYKPPARRVWGYYVCPLLHRGQLVGRFEARRSPAGLQLLQLWPEPGQSFERRAWKSCFAALQEFQ